MNTRWVLATLWGLCILVLSAMPGKYFPSLGWQDLFAVDKLIHAFMYGLWAVLLWRCISKKSYAGLLFAVGLPFVFGYLMELGQGYLFVGRDYELLDQLANTVGIAVVGGFVLWRFYRESVTDS